MKASIVWIFCGVVLAGCQDKAAPYLETCSDLMTKGDLDHAKTACDNAVTMDPSSTAGKAAKAKLENEVKPALAQAAAAKAKADQAATLAQQKAAQVARAQLEASCNGGHWLTICDIGPNGSGQLLSNTLGECEGIVNQQRNESQVSCEPCRCLHY